MKHLKTFEKWSPKFNRTLQGAYQQAQVSNKGFGKAAKSVLDYANRSISKEVFSVELPSRVKITFTHDPEFILKPIQTFIKENGDLSKDKNYLIIPILAKTSTKPDGTETSFEKDECVLLFKDGKIRGYKKNRDSSGIGNQDMELRFSDRKGIENFFAMTIQAVLSSPERVSLPSPFRKLQDWIPGDTIEKQTILGLIQNHILDKDQRQYTM
jgi:hypothetical protein